jgi:hypothetical protein
MHVEEANIAIVTCCSYDLLTLEGPEGQQVINLPVVVPHNEVRIDLWDRVLGLKISQDVVKVLLGSYTFFKL